MASAVKFHDWDFLQQKFSSDADERRKWKCEKDKAYKEAEEWNCTKMQVLEGTKVFGLSRQFQMFNEDVIKSPDLKDVVDLRR